MQKMREARRRRIMGCWGWIEQNLDDEEEREYRQMDLSIFSVGV